jgi:drug/metabolite transporter (DMT)-like permease
MAILMWYLPYHLEGVKVASSYPQMSFLDTGDYFRHLLTFPLDLGVRLMPWLLLAWAPFCVAIQTLDPTPIFSRFLRTLFLVDFFLLWITPLDEVHDWLILLGPLAIMTALNYELNVRRYGNVYSRLGNLAAAVLLPGSAILLLGFFLFAEGALCFAAAKYTTAARTSLFANTSPVFTLLISFICAKELLSGRKILGVLMGLGGIVLAALSRGGDAFTSAGMTTLGGDLLALLSGFFWALFTVFGGDASSRYNGAFCTVLYRFCGLILMVPMLFFCDVTFNFSWKVWGGLIYLAAISGGIAVWLWSYAQKHVEPGVLGSFGYLSAICATLFSMIFLKESITPSFIIAFVMILGGMTLIISSGKKEKKAEV